MTTLNDLFPGFKKFQKENQSKQMICYLCAGKLIGSETAKTNSVWHVGKCFNCKKEAYLTAKNNFIK